MPAFHGGAAGSRECRREGTPCDAHCLLTTMLKPSRNPPDITRSGCQPCRRASAPRRTGIPHTHMHTASAQFHSVYPSQILKGHSCRLACREAVFTPGERGLWQARGDPHSGRLAAPRTAEPGQEGREAHASLLAVQARGLILGLENHHLVVPVQQLLGRIVDGRIEPLHRRETRRWPA